MNTSIPIVLISGPVGVGKSVVGGETAEILEARQIPHTFIDFDHLRYTYPKPADDPWGNRLGLKNLDAIWRNCYRSGSLNLVISYVVENQSFVDMIREIIPEGNIATVQLSATLETLETRLSGREIGSGLAWHINRAGELAAILANAETPCDLRIETDGCTVLEISEEIANRFDWRVE